MVGIAQNQSKGIEDYYDITNKEILRQAKLKKAKDEVINLLEKGGLQDLKSAYKKIEDKTVKQMLKRYLLDVCSDKHVFGFRR